MIRRLFRRAPRVLPSLDAYALWAAEYPPVPHNLLMQLEQDAMLTLLPSVAGSRVLDLACGTGRYGALALERGAQQVVGVDNSPAMVARVAWGRAVVAPCDRLPLPADSVQVVLCGLALGHLPALEPTLHEIARVLRPGGVALISDFHPVQAQRGAQRTFTAEGRVYAVEHTVHTVDAYHRAVRACGLTISGVVEPEYEGRPVVLALRLEKR